MSALNGGYRMHTAPRVGCDRATYDGTMGRFDPSMLIPIQQATPAAQEVIAAVDRIGIDAFPADMVETVQNQRDYLAVTLQRVEANLEDIDRTHYDRIVELTANLRGYVDAFRAGAQSVPGSGPAPTRMGGGGFLMVGLLALAVLAGRRRRR